MIVGLLSLLLLFNSEASAAETATCSADATIDSMSVKRLQLEDSGAHSDFEVRISRGSDSGDPTVIRQIDTQAVLGGGYLLETDGKQMLEMDLFFSKVLNKKTSQNKIPKEVYFTFAYGSEWSTAAPKRTECHFSPNPDVLRSYIKTSTPKSPPSDGATAVAETVDEPESAATGQAQTSKDTLDRTTAAPQPALEKPVKATPAAPPPRSKGPIEKWRARTFADIVAIEEAQKLNKSGINCDPDRTYTHSVRYNPGRPIIEIPNLHNSDAVAALYTSEEVEFSRLEYTESESTITFRKSSPAKFYCFQKDAAKVCIDTQEVFNAYPKMRDFYIQIENSSGNKTHHRCHIQKD
jgi:hypothetical protein